MTPDYTDLLARLDIAGAGNADSRLAAAAIRELQKRVEEARELLHTSHEALVNAEWHARKRAWMQSQEPK